MWQVPPGDGPGGSRRPALGCVSRIYAVASGRRRDGSQGGGGAHSGAMGDDVPGAPGENAPAFSLGWGCAARRPSGGRAAGWRSVRHALSPCQALLRRVRLRTSYSCTMALAYPWVSPCSSDSQCARSSQRRNAGPDSRLANHSGSARPVTDGMRAIRFLCVSGEWFRVNWHLQGATPAPVESESRPRSWQPPEPTSSKRGGALREPAVRLVVTWSSSGRKRCAAGKGSGTTPAPIRRGPGPRPGPVRTGSQPARPPSTGKDGRPHGRAGGSGKPLDHHGHALAAAHAHRLQAERLVVELEAVQQGGGDPRPGHAERVPDRDRPAVDVQLVDVDADVLVGRDHLGRERLVDLDEVDVVDGHARPRQRLLGC